MFQNDKIVSLNCLKLAKQTNSCISTVWWLSIHINDYFKTQLLYDDTISKFL